MSDECGGVLDRVYAYVDGEVPEDDVESIRRHLQDCAPCLAEYEVEAALKALVRRSCAERAPDHLRQRIMASITRVTSTDGRIVLTSEVTTVTTATSSREG